ncbi:MAG: ABC transporter substrate-binding protein [Clostridiales bacterium]|nr:ABC transporter substrate-binding protein [Clostridiales bacterium]
MKRRISLLLAMVLIIALALSGCGGGGTDTPSGGDAPAQVKDTLVIQQSADPGDLNPFNSSLADCQRIKNNVYEPLIVVGYDMKISPVLAESYKQLDDLHWEFKLRKGVKFHDGADFTAKDVLFTLQEAAKVKTSAKYVENIDIEKCEIVDDYTFKFTLKKNDAFFLTGLSYVLMVDTDTFAADPDKFVNKPIGTGPYAFVDWQLGDKVTLKAFDGHWSGKTPQIKTVVFRTITEPAQRTIELETGAVDFLTQVPQNDFTRLESDSRFEVLGQIGNQTEMVYFNNSKFSAMSNKALRHAVAYAINTPDIAKVAFGGFAEPSFSFYTKSFVNHNPKYDKGIFYPQDIEKAKQLMAQAGQKEGLKLKMFISEKPEQVATAEIIQNQLAKIGIQMEIVSLEAAVFNQTIEKPESGWDIAYGYNRAPSSHFIDMLNAYYNSSGLNRSHWKNDEFDQLILEGTVTTEAKRAGEIADRVIEIMSEELPSYPLVQLKDLYAWNKDLKGFKVYGQYSVYVADLTWE